MRIMKKRLAGKHYFVKKIIIYMVLLILLLGSLLVAYTLSSFSILGEEIRQKAQNLAQICGNEMRGYISRMDKVLHDLLLQHQSDLQLLKSESESDRFYALQRINNYIRNVMQSDTSVSCIVVADSSYDLSVEAGVASVGYWDRMALREYTVAATGQSGSPSAWRFVMLNGRAYLYKMYVYNGRAVAAFTTTQSFLSGIPAADDGDHTFVLTVGDGTIADFLGTGLSRNQVGLLMEDIPDNQTFTASYVVVEGQVTLHNRVRNAVIWNQARIGMVVSLAVAVATLVFGAVLIRYLQLEMLTPTKRLTEVMTRIDDGEHELRLKDDFNTVEFSKLKDTFNGLMDEIMNLKIQGYEKMIALQDMELKSIRLQIHPHFFLNAISTISSLSSQGRDAEIQTYVDALSKNIRYMFKSGLHTVPVREEIRHIQNFFDMQECKYPGCLFYFIELPQEAEEWLIPQMLIQTFVENEYKYAVSVDSALTLFIRIDKREYKGEEMLLIRVEDDGKGYPEDVLRYMNGQAPRPINDGSRIGLWSVKRMMELMYERDDLVELSNIQPHGCMNRIWVPKVPVHEFTGETSAGATIQAERKRPCGF